MRTRMFKQVGCKVFVLAAKAKENYLWLNPLKVERPKRLSLWELLAQG